MSDNNTATAPGSGVYKTEEFSCTRDGLTIRGLAHFPVTDAPGKLPAVILSHGFKANMSFVEKYAVALAENGYAAFSFDFCGGCSEGKSEGDTTGMSVLTEKEDLAAVYRYVSQLSMIDPTCISLLGCSQGGLVSALYAAELEESGQAVPALVLFYPALCIPDDARKGQMAETTFDPANLPETFLSGSMWLGRRYAADAMGLDPYREISGYHGPVLIVYGEKDPVVAYSYIDRAAEVYGGNPGSRCVVLPGAGHGFSGADAGKASQEVLRFLDTVIQQEAEEGDVRQHG